MKPRISRRGVLSGVLVGFGLSTSASAEDRNLISNIEKTLKSIRSDTPPSTPLPRTAPVAADEQYYDPALLPPAESPVDFPIPYVSPTIIPARYRAQTVEFTGSEERGSLVVDPANRFLFHVLAYGQARRYGVGVGRAGFAWAGEAVIGMKRRWPRWVPPRQMVDRDPNARRWVNGQPGGPTNPLGARAMYLFANGRDTLYRIHGTNEPRSIGKAVSSGCIRMLNEDVAELFDAVEIGTRVVVRASNGVFSGGSAAG
jgi:lipoprotein-anchoring transpeptidase ErfK/SrfK